jgi:hypothetical protein
LLEQNQNRDDRSGFEIDRYAAIFGADSVGKEPWQSKSLDSLGV